MLGMEAGMGKINQARDDDWGNETLGLLGILIDFHAEEMGCHAECHAAFVHLGPPTKR